jgi:hypothetical protein
LHGVVLLNWAASELFSERVFIKTAKMADFGKLTQLAYALIERNFLRERVVRHEARGAVAN